MTKDRLFEDFIWHSNRIENVWTDEQEKKIREQIRAYQKGKHDECTIDPNIKGHFRGWKYISGIKRPTIARVRRLHKIMFTGCQLKNGCQPGVMRSEDGQRASIGRITLIVDEKILSLPRYKFPDPDKVLEGLKKWKAYSGNPLERHLKFEMIHPFADGNGRVGRMLWAGETSIAEATIKYEERREYYKLFEQYNFKQ